MKRSYTRPDRRQMTLWLLSVFIVASMLCSLLVFIRPPQQPALPTPLPFTEVPRVTDTPVPGTPTPTETPTPSPTP